MGIEAWSTTAASNNASPPNGAPEGMAASTVNDTMRQIMASIRAWFEAAEWINFSHTPTRIDNDTFTVATDQTAVYHVGRRLKFTGGATAYATIVSSSYGAPDTTVNVTMDSGNLPSPLTTVSVGATSAINSSTSAALLAASNTFTGAINTLSHATPDLDFFETDGPANEKDWYIVASSGLLAFGVRNDAMAGAANFMLVDRTGTVVDSIALAATTVTVNGVSVRDGAIINAGTVAAARIDTALARNNGTETISGAWTYSTRPKFTSAGGFLAHNNAANVGGKIVVTSTVPTDLSVLTVAGDIALVF